MLLLNNRSFSLLTVGELISGVLTSVTGIVLTFQVLDITNSGAQSATVLAATFLPSFLSIFAGAVLSRFSAITPLIVCNVIRALTILAVYLLIVSKSSFVVEAIFVSSFVNGLLGAIYVPAYLRAVPLLVDPKNLIQATSTATAVSQAGSLIGLAVGGILIGVFGHQKLILATSVTFFVSALLFSQVKIPLINESINRESIIQSFISGWRSLQANAFTRAIPLLAFTTNAIFAIILGKMPIHLKSLGLKEGEFGFFQFSMIFGLILGSGLYQIVSKFVKSQIAVACIGLGLFPILLLVMSQFTASYTIMLLINILIGLSIALVNNSIQTTIAQEIPKNLHGNVYSLFYGFGQAGIPITLLFAAQIIARVDIGQLLIIVSLALLAIISLFIVYLVRNPLTRTA